MLYLENNLELADAGSSRPRAPDFASDWSLNPTDQKLRRAGCARKKRPAKLLVYPHATSEKLLRFRRGWIFLLVTRILQPFLNERFFSNRYRADVGAGPWNSNFEDEDDDEDSLPDEAFGL